MREAWRALPVHEAVEALAQANGEAVYVVGGAVRDVLLGRLVCDWDLAVRNAASFAPQLVETLGARLVLLHEDTATYRLILPSHDSECPSYLDVVSFRAHTIEADLCRRDFSLNALAYDLPTKTLLDPCGGLTDLREQRLRALGLANLHADPLRCVRAYRFYSQLGFGIEPQTREWLRETAPLVANVAGERVGEEFIKMLQPPRGAAAVRLMDEDGVLTQVIPEIEPARGMEQGRYHHLDVWGHTLDVVANMETVLAGPEEFLPRSAASVEEYLARQDMPATLLLTALLHDLAKPPCRVQDERGWWRFFEHDLVGARMAGKITRRLRLRRELGETVRRLIRNHLRPLQLANLRLPQPERPQQEITMSALRRLFRETHPDGIGLLLLGLSDAMGCRGPATGGEYHVRLAVVLDEMLQRYFTWREQQPHRPLLTGADLIAAGHQPGETFGRVLAAVEDAHADQVIRTKEEALELAAELLAREQEAKARAGKWGA